MAGTNASIRALHDLLANTRIPDKALGKHILELTGRNDRLVAVVCGALVERNLQGLLESVMPNGPGSLFEPLLPLGSFSAKIKLAYSLNLINADIRRNADYIREIRNTFAHRIAPTSFRTKEVAAVCRLLFVGKEGNRIPKNMRGRYSLVAMETGAALTRKRYAAAGSPPASFPEKLTLLRFHGR